MVIRAIASGVLASISGAAAAQAVSSPPFDAAHAQAYFDEARKVSDKEAGRTWGQKLYGPIFFVDPDSGRIIANQQDPKGLLRRGGPVFEGPLPKEITPSDSPIEWEGTRWTMLLWPLVPDDRLTREKMFAHEMFHRIQPALHLDAPDTPNLQLDTADGRLWLQLEWRALAAALIERGPAQVEAIRDALAFRQRRHQAFPGSAKSEQSLEIAEGIPEYTGLVAAAADLNTARWYAVQRLADPDQSISFVRAFAYVSGPPYGLLLDERLPGWRRTLGKDSDLASLLASTVGGAGSAAEARSAYYGAAAIRVAEADRAAKAEAMKARYRNLLVDGPTLMIASAGHFNFTFNPSAVVSIEAGAVYPTFKASDAWGTLNVTDGALLPMDFSKVTIPAPTKIVGSHIDGPGWTLDLAHGWTIGPAAKFGSFVLRKN
jgi:hypothetical protein